MPHDSPDPISFSASARRPGALIAIAGVWVAIVGLIVVFHAAWYIVLPVGLFTLPAAFEAARGGRSELELDDTVLRWRSSSGRDDEVRLTAIDRAGVRIRLDLSRRVRIYRTGGGTIVIPHDCVPPGDSLERGLSARGIRIVREYFG